MSRVEILQTIRSCAMKLKHNPSRRDLRRLRISETALYKHFGGLKGALEKAGLRPSGPGFAQRESTVLLDWARVARKLRKIPTVTEYESRGGFSDMPFHTRYGNWTSVPNAFQRFARKEKIQSKWKDVLGMIGAQASKVKGSMIKVRASHQRTRKQDIFHDRPLYGPLMNLPEMVHEPLNELGVVFAFGLVARQLGFSVLRFQSAFPDCEALREVVRGQLQRMKLEFEFESRNFLRHGHRIDGCDGIVCWKHNWKECPLEVIELRKEIAKIARIAKIAEIEKQNLYPQRMQMTQRNLPRIDADERG
jgi:Homing endonuclease associated repeat